MLLFGAVTITAGTVLLCIEVGAAVFGALGTAWAVFRSTARKETTTILLQENDALTRSRERLETDNEELQRKVGQLKDVMTDRDAGYEQLSQIMADLETFSNNLKEYTRDYRHDWNQKTNIIEGSQVLARQILDQLAELLKKMEENRAALQECVVALKAIRPQPPQGTVQ